MRYTARVVPGRGEGRKLGFPTLNLEIPAAFAAKTKQGIYAAWVWLDANGPGPKKHPAAIHYGPAIAFGIQTPSLEAHVINADIPNAPSELMFELVTYLREVKDFNGSEALATQIDRDVKDALAALRNAGDE